MVIAHEDDAHELDDVAGGSVPEVDGLREADGKEVGVAPVHDVEVVVVQQVGRVEDALGGGGDVAEAAAGARGGAGGLVLAVEHVQGVDEVLARSLS